MRIRLLISAVFAVSAISAISALALPLSAQIDTYWQRQSLAKAHEALKPFRKPEGTDLLQGGRVQLSDLFKDLRRMQSIAQVADSSQIVYDKYGREICKSDDWAKAHEQVKMNSLRMAGHLGIVLRMSKSVATRGVAAYGLFYFNDPQQVLDLIAHLPGEPVRAIRERGFQRALKFLEVYLPKSKPQNPKFLDNGVVVPRFIFNPWPFMQLLVQEKPIDQAQGLWFLTEVLNIRPDLGRAYLFELELQGALPGLLTSTSLMVRQRCVDLLSVIDRKKHEKPKGTATNRERLEWLEKINHDLFPPIRHISSGLTELHPSKDLDDIVSVGRKALLAGSISTTASGTLEGGRFYRGLRITSQPTPLDLLGFEDNVVITHVNGIPIASSKDLLKNIQDLVRLHKKNGGGTKETKDKPRQRKALSIQIEYVHKAKVLVKEFRFKT